MKYLISMLLIIFLISCSSKTADDAVAQSQKSLTVNFMHSGFSEAISKAKQENKPMLVDVYATWCVPCKRLDKIVFSDKEAGEFINSRFVSLKVDGEKGEGPELLKKFNIPGYPTILLVDQSGEEIDRLVGFDGNKEEWVQTLKNYMEGKNTLQDYLSRLETESTNVELNYNLAEKYLYRENEEKALGYYQKVVELDPADKHEYQDDAQYQIATLKMRINKNPQALKEFLKNSTHKEYVEAAYRSLARYYRNQKNVPELVATYEDAIARFPKNASMMNAYAWDIFRLKLEEHYDRGIAVAKKAVEIEPDAAAIWDTLGQLQFADGNVSEAIEAMQKAADLEPDTQSFKDNLEKYKKSQMKT